MMRQLSRVVSAVVDLGLSRRQYYDVIGLAVEMRSIEVLERAILASVFFQ